MNRLHVHFESPRMANLKRMLNEDLRAAGDPNEEDLYLSSLPLVKDASITRCKIRHVMKMYL